jgi:hypothetical protein
MRRLPSYFRRACEAVDEAKEHIDAALGENTIDPVLLRMAARKLTAAAKLLETKEGTP